MHEDISGSLGIATFGASGGSGICAQFNLASQNGIDSLGIDHQQHKIRCLAAELEANVGAFQGHHRRWSPRTSKGFAAAAGHSTATVVSAYTESKFFHRRNYDHAF